ncbi:MAG TPA: hypothetical protein PKZ84_06575 [Anaerolineae bacterium]|nr:hypothetical protein [Anaerolineae bacterium]HQI83351.1 hypothetical protein [Anaerolineae bacterium]
MNATAASQGDWRARSSGATLADDEPTALETWLDSLATAETPTLPTSVPPHWEDLVADRLAQCHLPAGVLDRLIAEAVVDALPAMAEMLERKLRFRIRREQRAQLQTCDDY